MPEFLELEQRHLSAVVEVLVKQRDRTDYAEREARVLREAIRAIAQGMCADPVKYATDTLRTLSDTTRKPNDSEEPKK